MVWTVPSSSWGRNGFDKPEPLENYERLVGHCEGGITDEVAHVRTVPICLVISAPFLQIRMALPFRLGMSPGNRPEPSLLDGDGFNHRGGLT